MNYTILYSDRTASASARRAASDHTATMWLNKNGLFQPDDVIVYCIQSTQHDVSQAGGIYATLDRDNYLWSGGHKP